MAIRKELINELMATSDGPLIGPDGLSASTLSHHLEKLKNEDVVKVRRDSTVSLTLATTGFTSGAAPSGQLPVGR